MAPATEADDRCLVDREYLDTLEREIVLAQVKGDGRRVREMLTLYDAARLLYDRWRVRRDFLHYVRLVRPDVILARHHHVLAEAFERIATRELLRLMIFMPPGFGKSLFTSILMPSWLLGMTPSGRILAASHTMELVTGFGREIRDLVQTAEYQRLFPDMVLRPDVKAAGRWHTTERGQYNAIGVGGAAAGRRADLAGLVDDALSEQDAFSDVTRKAVNNWFRPGFLTRLLPGTPVCLMNTRWHTMDLSGFLLDLARNNPDIAPWEVINIPALVNAEVATLLEMPAGQSSFPELWPTKYLLEIKAEMPPFVWDALYEGNPSEDQGRILLKTWWKAWDDKATPLPEFEYVIQVWDTAFEEDEDQDGDFCACTTWGVFYNDKTRRHGLMLLARYNKRVGFPDLRADAKELYDEFEPDEVLIEPKASGKSLIQELRRAKLPVREWQPERTSRGREKSKFARAHTAAIVLYGGDVWYPKNRRWAEEVIEQCAKFPAGEHDDLVDTVTMAMLYLRRSWWAQLDDEEPEEPPDPRADGGEAAYG